MGPKVPPHPSTVWSSCFCFSMYLSTLLLAVSPLLFIPLLKSAVQLSTPEVANTQKKCPIRTTCNVIPCHSAEDLSEIPAHSVSPSGQKLQL